MHVTFDVQDGKGKATIYGETRGFANNNTRALRGGAIVYLFADSQSNQGVVEGQSDATVNVSIDPASKTYFVTTGVAGVSGKEHRTQCDEQRGCKESDGPFPVLPCLRSWSGAGIDGKTDDPNHVQGSKTDVKLGVGRTQKGRMTWLLTWNLARQGTTK